MPAVLEVKVRPVRTKEGRITNSAYFVYIVRGAGTHTSNKVRLIGKVYKRKMPKTCEHPYLWGWISDADDIFGFTRRKYTVKDLIQAQYPIMPQRESLACRTNLFYGTESRPDLPEA